MIYGTHNSATGGQLLWWLRPFAWVEGANYSPHLPYGARGINLQERYWTTTWARINATSWLDKLPLPKRHAKRWNSYYKEVCDKEYLMLDFYEI
jgi:hypothetical protein